MGRRDEELPPDSLIGQPDMRMAQMKAEKIEDDHQNVELKDAEHHRVRAPEEAAKRKSHTAKYAGEQYVHGIFQRVHPPGRKRRQDLGRVMHLVKFPKNRDLVLKVMTEPQAEI